MKILVIGIGVSGLSVIDYFLKRKDEVVAVDRKGEKESCRCPVFPDTHRFSPFDFDLVVPSPGVFLDHPLCQRALRKNIPVIGEPELAFQKMDNRIIAVTGSNGKSVTTALIAHILNRFGYCAKALGNIGVPFLSSLDSLDKKTFVIAELSSFQLERLNQASFEIAIFLNVAKNHLDWHGTMENYVLSKGKIGMFVKKGGVFGVEKEVAREYGHLLATDSYTCIEKKTFHQLPNRFAYLFPHLTFACFVCRQFGLKEEEVLSQLPSFPILPHRLEFVGEFLGVKCYNDSKATTPEAVCYAVKIVKERIVLIAGGRDKGGDFSSWKKTFKGSVQKMILLGEAKEQIAKEIPKSIPLYFVNSLEEAVEKGLQLTKGGDNLLLSPGCSSLDMFRNFEQRGEIFKKGLEYESKRYYLNIRSH